MLLGNTGEPRARKGTATGTSDGHSHACSSEESSPTRKEPRPSRTGDRVYSSIPQSLYFQLESDANLDMNALTLMEQVVLLGLKDKQVCCTHLPSRASKKASLPNDDLLGLYVAVERLDFICATRLLDYGAGLSRPNSYAGGISFASPCRTPFGGRVAQDDGRRVVGRDASLDSG